MPLASSLRRSAALAAALLALSSPRPANGAGVSEKGLAKMRAKSDFMRAMGRVNTGVANAAASRARRRAAGNNLRKKLAAKARPMPASMRADFESSNAAAAVAPPAFMSKNAHAASTSATTVRRLDGENDEDDYGFDVTQFSFKYAGCSAVATYSDDMAGDEEYSSVVMAKRFVVFRLCPTAYCSDDYPYGCGGGYGEYIVDMDDYLDIMAQYQEEKLERYCEYCEECMEVNEEEEEEEQQDDEEEEEEEEDNEEDEEDQDDEEDDGDERKRRRLDDADGDEEDQEEDEDENDEDAEEGNDEEENDEEENDNAAANEYCADYQACNNYAYVCGDDENDNGDDDEEEEVDYKDFFECQEVDNDNDNNNGNAYFVGPHCSYDKKTITVGLYTDEYCSEYVGNDVDISNVLGFYIDGDALADYYDEDCVTCNAADLPYQNQDEDGDDDDEEEEAEVTELCELLFEEAGKCHKYMEDVDEEAYGENQAENEDTVCGFIQNVVTGQYDELGYIYLSADDYSKDNRDNQYATTASEVSIGQIFGLLVTALACIILVVWACFLHRKLTRRAPWRPRRAGGSGAKAGKLSRNNSGILMGRSRSGGSYHGGAMT